MRSRVDGLDIWRDEEMHREAHQTRKEIRDSGFGIQNLLFGIWDSGSRIRDSCFRIWDSGFGIQDSGFGFQDSGFRIQISGFVIRDSGVGGYCTGTTSTAPSTALVLQVLPPTALVLESGG